jgi:hypothetical protein
MSYSLNNVVSAAPGSSSIGSNNSWIEVQGNLGRPLYAAASYITNLSDINISLSTGDLNIGSVELVDPDNHNLKASIVSIGVGQGALRVLSQDLEPIHDTVSLGDILGNNVGVNSSLSALKVFLVNSPGTENWGVLSASLVGNGFTNNNFTTLYSNVATQITVSNSTNKTLWIRKSTQNIAFPLPIDRTIEIDLISNTNEVALATEGSSALTVYCLYTKKY